jgi:hypothetical protein
MNAVLEPILKDAITRFSKFNKPEQRDALRILGPALEAICLDAKAPAERATEWLQSQNPESLTAESVREFLRSLTEAPAIELEAARARQEQIERETQKPLTARELVLLERQKPLAERTRQSIADELNEANTGRMADGTDLPHLDRRHWDALEPHYAALERELEMRDCTIAGIPYSGDKEKHTGMVGYAMSPR